MTRIWDKQGENGYKNEQPWNMIIHHIPQNQLFTKIITLYNKNMLFYSKILSWETSILHKARFTCNAQ